MWLFKFTLNPHQDSSKDGKRSNVNTSSQCSASVAARKLLVETQESYYDSGTSMQAGKCTARDGIVESLCHPAVARTAGIRDAQGCECLWCQDHERNQHRIWLGKPCLEGFLGFLILLHQSVVETKCIQLMKLHSLWPNDCFVLIKWSSCCRARGTRSFQSSRAALQVLPPKSHWPKRKRSQAGVLLERNS